MSATLIAVAGSVGRSTPVPVGTAGAPPGGGGGTFAEWLASTAGGAGPTRHFPMDDTGSTMAPSMYFGSQVLSGTYVNTGDLRRSITDAESEIWTGFGGATTNPGHATLLSPLPNTAITIMMIVQFDVVKSKHIIATSGASTTAGQFSFEIVDDGAGGLKPRVWSVNTTSQAVIYSGTDTGSVPVGLACAMFYVRRSNGTQEAWRVVPGDALNVGLTLDSGTPPGSWSAVPAGTVYVGAYGASALSPLNGVARGLTMWNSALSASDIEGLASIDPPIQDVVWAAAIDAGSVLEDQTLADVDITNFVHPEVGYTSSIQTQGSLGTWFASSNLLSYVAGSSSGTDTAGRYRTTKGSINSPNAALTVTVQADETEFTDLPFFGEYYGQGTTSHFNGQYECRGTGSNAVTFFFYAERTGQIDRLHWHWRHRHPEPGYSAGDGGTYTLEIVPANPSTRRPVSLTGGTVLSRITGVDGPNPPNTSAGEHPTYTLTTLGTVVAGNPYCVRVINTHANPGGNFVSQNATAMGAFPEAPGGGEPEFYTEPGEGSNGGGYVVASGGINGSAVGSSPAIIRGWLPHHLDGHDWYPYPMGWRDGTLRYVRIGGIHCAMRYTDGVWTGWGRGSAERNYICQIGGTNQVRERFKVTRASRTVSGVFIRAWRIGTGGSVLVRLESGPNTDAHTAGNGTLIEQVSIPASMWLLSSGSTVGPNYPDFAKELIHYVWCPFTENHTLALGSIYNLRLVPSGCNVWMVCPSRDDQEWGLDGHSASTWAQWASGREVSWTVFEDSRGCQISANSGTSWAYGPAAGRAAPITFKCV